MSITSLMRPGRAVITATRSPSRIASSIEWVMNTDRKSTRLNSSHDQISYAVFCLKKKKKHKMPEIDGTSTIGSISSGTHETGTSPTMAPSTPVHPVTGLHNRDLHNDTHPDHHRAT